MLQNVRNLFIVTIGIGRRGKKAVPAQGLEVVRASALYSINLGLIPIVVPRVS